MIQNQLSLTLQEKEAAAQQLAAGPAGVAGAPRLLGRSSDGIPRSQRRPVPSLPACRRRKQQLAAALAGLEAHLASRTYAAGRFLQFKKLVYPDSQEAEAAAQQVAEGLAGLEAHLASRTYVAGDALSLADLVVAADLKPAFEQVSCWRRSLLSQRHVIASSHP